MKESVVKQLETKEIEQKYLTTKQAACYLGLSPRTLDNMRCRGIGPKFYRVGTFAIRYKVADLIAWAESDASNGGAS